MDNTPDIERLETTQQGVSEGTKARQARKVRGKSAASQEGTQSASASGFLANLKINRKLALIALAFVIPLLAVFALYAASQRTALSTATTELRGLEYLPPLARVLESVSLHRDLSIRSLSGNTSLAPQRDTAATEVNAALSALVAVQERYGEGFGTSEYVTKLVSDWEALERLAPTLNPAVSFETHSALISERVFPLLEQVADRSGLGLDSELSDFYLAKLTLETLPRISESLSQLRDQGSGILTRQTITAQEQQQLGTLVARIEGDLSEIRRDVSIATEGQPPYAAALEQNLAEFENLASYTLAITRYNLADRFNVQLGPVTFFREATRSVDSSFGFLSTTVSALSRDLDAQISSLRLRQLLNTGGLVLAVILSTLLVIWVARQITRPVNELATVAERVGRGDYSRFARVGAKDELGTLANSFNLAIAGLREASQRNEVERQQAEQLQTNVGNFLDVAMDIAGGDFTKRGVVSEDALGNVIDAINLMVEEVAGLLQDVQQAALSVNQGAGEMIGSSGAIAESADLTAGEAQRVRTQVENVMASIREMATQADNASDAATSALRASRQGQEAVTSTLTGMAGIREETRATAERVQRLGDRSNEISEIVETISHIASQTNLLALGAALEAAGAGEAGDRFGVVADEVRKLADESAEAAGRIFTLISTVQTEVREVGEQVARNSLEVESGYALAGRAGERLREISDSVQRSARLAESISRATDAQTSSVEEVGSSVASMAELTQNARERVIQGQQSAATLQNVASRLSEALVRFRLA